MIILRKSYIDGIYAETLNKIRNTATNKTFEFQYN